MKKIYFLFSVFMVISCTEDRIIMEENIVSPNSELIHYWDFNNVNILEPSQTIGGALLSYQGASFDPINEGTILNAQNNSQAGNALRLRNPAGDFIIKIPTLGYKNIVVSFATMRTNNGAKIQTVSYSLDGVNFTSNGLINNSYGVNTSFQFKQFDFTQIEGVKSNPNFTIRIQFSDGADGDSGNNRFDNLAVFGEVDPDYVPVLQLIHLWNFNSLPSGTLNDPINADFSLLDVNNTQITYEGSGSGYMDRSTTTNTINLRNNDESGYELRVRNPADTRSLIINAPTTNYKDIVLKFATYSTDNGSQEQTYSYSIDGTNFINTSLATTSYTFSESLTYFLVTIDFSNIPQVNNNPNFKVKIDFTGSNASNTSGNNRFDNITFEGFQN